MFFVLFVVFAAIAAVSVAWGFNNMAGLTAVAVAQGDILADEAASPGKLGTTKIPKGAVQLDTIRNPMDLKGYSARGFVPAGTVLRKSMFQPIEKAGTVAKLSLMPGKKAIALDPTLNTTCGGSLKAGCYIDIWALGKDGSVDLMGEDIEVLSVPEQSSGVVIAVDDETAERIFRAHNSSSFVATLLPPEEVNE